MNKKVLTLLGLLIIIVGVLGCATNEKPQKMIIKFGNSTVTQQPTQTTSISGILQNVASYDYTNVQIEIIGLDVNGEALTSKKTIITEIKSDGQGYYNVSFPYDPKIVAGDVKVLYADSDIRAFITG